MCCPMSELHSSLLSSLQRTFQRKPGMKEYFSEFMQKVIQNQQAGEAEHGTGAKEFVLCNFYFNDGITSVTSEEIAIDLLKRMQRMLSTANLNLHKMASNSTAVMEAFPPEDRANKLKNLDLSSDPLPLQRSLGISRDLKSDCFTFRVSRGTRPFTRRGTLSIITKCSIIT